MKEGFLDQSKRRLYWPVAVIIVVLLGLALYSSTTPPYPEHRFRTVTNSVQFGEGVFTGVVQEAVVIEAAAPQYELPLDLDRVENIQTVIDRFRLDEAGLRLLSENGFVVVSVGQYDQFDEVYRSIDQLGAPVFVTADSMLHVYHVFFDEVLRSVEEEHFAPDMKGAVENLVEESVGLYNSIPAEHDVSKEASRRNVCFFCVAAKLLDPDFEVPGFANDLVESELTLIEAHDRMCASPIFGYVEDYTQYVPRGHYTRSETLKRYFRAMMWFGRMRFMAKSSDQPELARLQTTQAVLVVAALNDVVGAKAVWEKIYDATSFFVGYSDDLTVYDYESAVEEVYGAAFAPTDLEDASKLAILQDKLMEMNQAKIVSSPILPYQREELVGLRLMGQRLIPDSHIFQELVFNKVGDRFMPKGLDVLAVFGSERAKEHLSTDITTCPGYEEQLNKLKSEFSGLNASTWTQNLYWSWLYAINSTLGETPEGYPTFMTQPAWLDEKLNTALGSWTELRHDTILYAKQSYTVTGIPQPPPPGYVEPLPQLYSRLGGLCDMTMNGLESLGLLDEDFEGKLTQFRALLNTLKEISLKELSGESLTENEVQLIESIGHQLGLIMEPFTEEGQKSTLVADVHTDPNSGMVLEEGCGYIDFIVVVYKTTDGRLIAAAGPVFSYYEFQQPMSQRLTDEDWIEMITSGIVPARPTWTSSFRQ